MKQTWNTEKWLELDKKRIYFITLNKWLFFFFAIINDFSLKIIVFMPNLKIDWLMKNLRLFDVISFNSDRFLVNRSCFGVQQVKKKFTIRNLKQQIHNSNEKIKKKKM